MPFDPLSFIEKFGPTTGAMLLLAWVGYNYLNGLSKIKLQRGNLENQMFQQALEDRTLLRAEYRTDRERLTSLEGERARDMQIDTLVKEIRDDVKLLLDKVNQLTTKADKKDLQ